MRNKNLLAFSSCFHLCKKSKQMLGIIKSTFIVITAKTFPILFNALVRPHLEYGNVIWHPQYIIDDKKVESVQRRATNLVPELRNLKYSQGLQQLNLFSLYYRRRCGDMIQVFKIKNGIDCKNADLFFPRPTNDSSRSNSSKIFKRRSLKKPRISCFSQRVVNDWDSLTNEIVESKWLDIFKQKLDSHWNDNWYIYTE